MKRRKPHADLDLSRTEGLWDAERDAGHILDGYTSLSSNRHHQLSCVAVKLGMSALNKGYDITARELKDIVAELHRSNPPTSQQYTDRDFRPVGGLRIKHSS